MEEEWKPIPGYEGYEASTHGRVRSIDRTIQCKNGQTRRQKGRLMRLKKSRDGYYRVDLCREGKTRTKSVHRLVLEAFISSCPEGMECLHRDGDPSNNRLDNLRWGDHSENMRDRVKHGTCHQTRKTHCPREHELIPENRIKNHWEKGRRNCLACHRAMAYIQRHPELQDQLKEVADRYFEAILKERTDSPAVGRHRDARRIMDRRRNDQRNEQQ